MAKRIVMCQFPGSEQHYAYYTNDDSIEVDDIVVVISPNAGAYHNHGWRHLVPQLGGYPTMVKVVSTDETVHGVMKATKEIIQKIDLSAAIAAAEHAKQVDLLKAKIARAKKEAIENAQLASLMELSPELGDLVRELANLTGVVLETKPIAVRAHKRKATPRAKPAAKGKAKVSTRRKTKA